jgi:glycine hydroxymethyltransferase
VRIGTPAVTTRGMGAGEMDEIVRLILETLEREPDTQGVESLRGRVAGLCRSFPIYTWLPRPAAVRSGGRERPS